MLVIICCFPLTCLQVASFFSSKNSDSRFSPSLIVYYLQIFRTKNPMGCLSMATPGCSIARWKSYIEMDLEGRTTGMTHLHWIAITINNDNYLNFDSCLHQHFRGIWTARQWWTHQVMTFFLAQLTLSEESDADRMLWLKFYTFSYIYPGSPKPILRMVVPRKTKLYP